MGVVVYQENHPQECFLLSLAAGMACGGRGPLSLIVTALASLIAADHHGPKDVLPATHVTLGIDVPPGYNRMVAPPGRNNISVGFDILDIR